MLQWHISQQVYLWYPLLILFGYISRSRMARSCGSSSFIVWATSVLFSILAAQICSPTHSAQMFSFLYILTTTCWFDNHFNKCKVIFLCGFDLNFPDDYWYWTPFHILAFFVSLEDYLFSSSVCFLIGLFGSYCWIVCCLEILDINPLSNVWFANIFSHFISGHFILLVSFAVQKFFG